MNTFKIFVLCALLFWPFCALAVEEESAVENEADQVKTGQPELERVYIVSEYRYEPVKGGKDSDIGQSLCGTRCDALSVDYLNYTSPGGWRMIKVSDKQELVVDLDNPFLSGKCICIAEEYMIKINDLYMSK